LVFAPPSNLALEHFRSQSAAEATLFPASQHPGPTLENHALGANATNLDQVADGSSLW